MATSVTDPENNGDGLAKVVVTEVELVAVGRIKSAFGREGHLELSEISLFVGIFWPFHITCCCLRESQVQVYQSHLPKVARLEAIIAKGESGLGFGLSDRGPH